MVISFLSEEKPKKNYSHKFLLVFPAGLILLNYVNVIIADNFRSELSTSLDCSKVLAIGLFPDADEHRHHTSCDQLAAIIYRGNVRTMWTSFTLHLN